MTSYNAVIVGQALNYEEVLDGTPLHSYLKILKNGLDDIIILNGGILNSYLRGVGTKFITIDYYTCNYLRNYASLQHKMYVESSVKREADIQKILPDVNNVFTISNNIETDPTNNKLYLNLTAPTVLQVALNLALKEGLSKGYKKGNINIFLLGISLDEHWRHCDQQIYPRMFTKSKETITNMRHSVYMYKNYCNLYTLNKEHNLFIEYISPRNIKF